MRYEGHIGLVTPPEVAAGMHRGTTTFAMIPDWLIGADISPAAFRVYAAITSFADSATRFAHPGKVALAIRSRMSVSSVERALAELKAIGAVWIFQRWRGARRGIITYSVTRDIQHNMQDHNGYVALWNSIGTTQSVTSNEGVPPPAGEVPPPPAGDPPPHPADDVQNKTPFSKPIHPEPRRRQPLPADWRASPELIEWARSRHPSVDLAHETEKFEHHYGATGARLLDWDRAWKFWVLRATEHRQRTVTPLPSRPKLLESTIEGIVELELSKTAPSADKLREFGIDPSPWFYPDGRQRGAS